MENDAHGQYLEDVQKRIMNLSDEEKTMLIEFKRTPEANLVAKIVGPDIAGLGGVEVDQFEEAITREPQPQQQQQEMPTPPGLGMRRPQ